MALELTMPWKTSVQLICLTISAFVSVHNSERIDHRSLERREAELFTERSHCDVDQSARDH